MSMLIQHNMMAWNAGRQFNIVTKAKDKKAEKLSSGYRINRAADDAAGLAISEKMRRQIRGFQAGTENAEMGISWVQIGEGALNEAHDILQRMNELTIKAQNGTNTLTDRAFIQAEFDQLQTELDRISDTTTFNDLPIFEEHEPVYDQICGNQVWDDMEIHEILAGKNKLNIAYREEGTSKAQMLTLEVPPGTYTTHELIDALDDAAGLDGPIHVEFTGRGTCNLNLENGEVMDSVSGDLTYLLWDNYDGGGYGTLIGTTSFYDDTTPILEVVKGQNDKMEFWIEYFDDDVTNPHPPEKIEIDLLAASGGKTKDTLSKNEVMKRINDQIAAQSPNSGLKADHHGEAIQLASPDGIVTGFKGNMFKMEVKPPDPVEYDSAFYDNIREGYVWQDPAFVVGGAVLTTDTRDKEHNRYYIDGSNDTLVLYPNKKISSQTGPTTIKITHNTTDGYTAAKMVEELNKQFKAAGIDGEVQAHLVRSKYRDPFPNGKTPDGSGTAVTESVGDTKVYFEGVEIRTVKEGPDAIVNFAKVKDANQKDTDQVDKTLSTAYDTLFTTKEWNDYSVTANDAEVNNQTRADVNASAYSARDWKKEPSLVVKNNVNDKFKLTLTSVNKNGGQDFTYTKVIDISNKTQTMSASGIAKAIQDQIDADTTLKGRLVAETWDDNGKTRIRIRDNEDLTLDNVNDDYMNWTTSISIENAGNNAGYRDIFQEKYTYEVPRTVSGNGSLTLDVSKKNGNSLVVYIDGERTIFDITGTQASDMAASMKKTTPIEFTSVSGVGTTSVRNVSASGAGATTVTPWAADKDTGTAEKHQGRPGVWANQPAQLAIGPARAYLKDNMTITAGVNDTITIDINGQGAKTLTLTAKTYAKADDLAEELQKQIDNNFGDATGWGRATVDVVGGQFVITCTIPKGKKGDETSIQSSNDPSKNKFFADLNTTKSAARAVSDQTLNTGSFTLTDGVDDVFEFTFDDGSGPQTVKVDLVEDPANPTTPGVPPKTQSFDNGSKAVDTINAKLAAMGVKVKATVENNRMVLTSTDTGNGISISYSQSGGSGKNADGIFGLSKETTASITLNKAVQKTGKFDSTSEEKIFRFTLDGSTKEVKIKGGWSSYTDLQNKLNNGPTADKSQGLTALGVKATISSSGILTLTKTTSGSGSLSMSYDSSNGSVMGDMFGYEPKPNVTVSSDNKKKTITITAPGKKISVPSESSSGLVQPTKVTAYADGYETAGFHSADYSTLTSTTLDADGYELNRWNNDFKFHFTEDGGKTYKEISVTLDNSTPGTKTSLNDIKDQLQAKLNAAMGSKKIEVLLDTNARKLSLKSVKPGAQFRFLTGNQTATVNGKTVRGLQSDSSDDGEVGGGFFHHVMCRRTPRKDDFADRPDVNGDQFAGDIYAMGRHDVVLDRASLHPGISDTLILDLNYVADWNHSGTLGDHKAGEKEETLKTITLELHPKTKVEDWLNSSDQEVLATLREQIDVAIENWNNSAEGKASGLVLNKGMIEVDIGRHDTGIWGNKDKVAISFTMTKNPDIATPVEGYFYIDGIRGNAAYETFYHTEGDLIPAYIVGTKDIRKGVTLGEDDNELVFLVDGKMEKVDLSNLEKGRKYSADEIIRAITAEFTRQSLPLAASITQNGALKISYDRMGKHTIEQVTGSARNELFYTEHFDKRLNQERGIRVSSNEGDRISLYSPRFSTMMLNINSICVSTVENAEKATNRLKEAITTVSEMRNTFGAIQNRIEHTINNNRNKEENTQAAESRIRDADISQEMVEYSNLNIIQQAGQAILAQANQSRNAMLALLG